MLIAEGCTIRQLSGLMIEGYADLQRRRIQHGDREKTVFWLQITDAGRNAIAG